MTARARHRAGHRRVAGGRAARRDGAVPAVPVAETLAGYNPTGAKVQPGRPTGCTAQTPVAAPLRRRVAPRRRAGCTEAVSLLEAAGCSVALVPGRVRAPAAAARRHRVRRACAGGRAAADAVRRRGAARAPGWPGTRTPMSASMRCATRSTARSPRAISAATSRRARRPGRTPIRARFLRHAAERIAARGGVLANADVTLICERPKIAPHAAAMIGAAGGPARRCGGSRSR